MWVNNARSVSEALSNGLHAVRVHGIKQESRVGDVLVHKNPALTVNLNPLNRVLFSPQRDANPFFHVMESLWMLAGHNDLPWLTQFNSKFAAYSDDGGQTQPGAYGYRWRQYFGYDQIEEIVVELRRNPLSRRCVLAMWDGGDHKGTYQEGDMLPDLLSAIAGSNDVPCNTHAYFDMVDGRLNMTVCCRSNDLLWGAHGANAVHFSFLLEYMAASIGCPIGVLRQFSNNYHLYTNVVAEEQLMPLARDVDATDKYYHIGPSNIRTDNAMALRRVPLVDPMVETGSLEPIKAIQRWMTDPFYAYDDVVPFLGAVARPMWQAWQAHKDGDYNAALDNATHIKAEDWRIACTEWLNRRKIKHDLNQQRFVDVVPPMSVLDRAPMEGDDNGAA